MIEINNRPRWADFQRAFVDLQPAIEKYWPAGFSDMDYFCRWMEGGHGANLLYDPLLFVNGSTVEALIVLKNHIIEFKTAEIHFAAYRPSEPLPLFRSVNRALERVLAEDEVDLLYAHHKQDLVVGRTAKLFGFDLIGRTIETDYRVRVTRCQSMRNRSRRSGRHR